MFKRSWSSMTVEMSHRIRTLPHPPLRIYRAKPLQLHPPAMFQILAPPQPLQVLGRLTHPPICLSPLPPTDQQMYRQIQLPSLDVTVDSEIYPKGVTPIPMPVERKQVKRTSKSVLLGRDPVQESVWKDAGEQPPDSREAAARFWDEILDSGKSPPPISP